MQLTELGARADPRGVVTGGDEGDDVRDEGGALAFRVG
jgi:hypothetical protein